MEPGLDPSAASFSAGLVVDTTALVVALVVLFASTLSPLVVAALILRDRAKKGGAVQSTVADLYSRLILGLCLVDAYTSGYMLIAGTSRLLPEYPRHAGSFFLWMQGHGTKVEMALWLLAQAGTTVWHLYIAFYIHGWIVRKASPGRLLATFRRVTLPLFLGVLVGCGLSGWYEELLPITGHRPGQKPQLIHVWVMIFSAVAWVTLAAVYTHAYMSMCPRRQQLQQQRQAALADTVKASRAATVMEEGRAAAPAIRRTDDGDRDDDVPALLGSTTTMDEGFDDDVSAPSVTPSSSFHGAGSNRSSHHSTLSWCHRQMGRQLMLIVLWCLVSWVFQFTGQALSLVIDPTSAYSPYKLAIVHIVNLPFLASGLVDSLIFSSGRLRLPSFVDTFLCCVARFGSSSSSASLGGGEGKNKSNKKDRGGSSSWRRALSSALDSVLNAPPPPADKEGESPCSSPSHHRSELIFLTTLNMGGVKAVDGLGAPLAKWLPEAAAAARYAMVVVGVQECLCLEELREAIHQHIGGPSAFVRFGSEIGDATLVPHGQIGITVYASRSLVEAGSLLPPGLAARTQVATGVKVGPFQMANKGSAGLAFRLHDITLGFAVAHLAADKHGRSRVKARCQDACQLLQRLVLSEDDEEFDAHLQHHVFFLLGDLNFRVAGRRPEEVLRLIAGSSSKEVECLGPAWRQERYSSLLGIKSAQQCRSPSPLAPVASSSPRGYTGLHEEQEQEQQEERGKGGGGDVWGWVREADELMREQREGRLLQGFSEAPIRFPPSFKRVPGTLPGDYSNVSTLRGSYVMSKGGSSSKDGGVEGDDESPMGDPRPPSYTDRVLYHMLPSLVAGQPQRALVTPLAYDMCDDVDGSDHRPVSLVASLSVNPLARPVALHIDSPIKPVSYQIRRQFFRFSIRLSNAVFQPPSQRAPPRTTSPPLSSSPLAGRGSRGSSTLALVDYTRQSSSGHPGDQDDGGDQEEEEGEEAMPSPPRTLTKRSSSSSSWLMSLPRSLSSASTSTGATSTVSDESSSISLVPHRVEVLFPLLAEDVLGPMRRVLALHTALLGKSNSKTEGAPAAHKEQQKPPPDCSNNQAQGAAAGNGGGNVRTLLWSECASKCGTRFDAVALYQPAAMGQWPLRLHCLVKLLDKQGRDIGQGVLPAGELHFLQAEAAASWAREQRRHRRRFGGTEAGLHHHQEQQQEGCEAGREVVVDMTKCGLPRGKLIIRADVTAINGTACKKFRTFADFIECAKSV